MNKDMVMGHIYINKITQTEQTFTGIFYFYVDSSTVDIQKLQVSLFTHKELKDFIGDVILFSFSYDIRMIVYIVLSQFFKTEVGEKVWFYHELNSCLLVGVCGRKYFLGVETTFDSELELF